MFLILVENAAFVVLDAGNDLITDERIVYDSNGLRESICCYDAKMSKCEVTDNNVVV